MGMVLDGLSLLDELVLGGSKTTLDHGSDGGGTELSSNGARAGAEHLSLRKHLVLF